MHRYLRIRISRLALLILIPALLGCTRGPCVAIVSADGKPRASVTVEIADTEPRREVGLMYRKHLDDSAGMVFVFKDLAHRNFWMHNTAIPLDMIFADANGRVIGIVTNAEPFSDKEVGVDGGSEYVLEVNGGFCAKNAIRVGDRLNFLGFSPHTSE